MVLTKEKQSFRGSIGFAEALVLLCLKYISLIVKYHLQTPWNEAEDLAETARKRAEAKVIQPELPIPVPGAVGVKERVTGVQVQSIADALRKLLIM